MSRVATRVSMEASIFPSVQHSSTSSSRTSWNKAFRPLSWESKWNSLGEQKDWECSEQTIGGQPDNRSWLKDWDSLQKHWYREFGYHGCTSRTLRKLLIWKNSRQRGTCQGLVLKALHMPAESHRILDGSGWEGHENHPLPWTGKSLLLFSQKWNPSRFGPESGELSTAQWVSPPGRKTSRQGWQSSTKPRFAWGKEKRLSSLWQHSGQGN